jgi:CheY-like chemotaxis protein
MLTNNYRVGVGKKTILICEDEPDLLPTFKLVLKSKYDVISVNSGKACIDMYIKERNKIDLILLDYKLRDMSGDSIARKIKEHNGTNIILISGYDLDHTLLKELEERKLYKQIRKETN